jgi:hypothetical protein
MANDEQPTDQVLFSTDEGLNWREYSIGEKIRVRSILTVPADTSRKFILMGQRSGSRNSVAVHVDFSSLTTVQCESVLILLSSIGLEPACRPTECREPW